MTAEQIAQVLEVVSPEIKMVVESQTNREVMLAKYINKLYERIANTLIKNEYEHQRDMTYIKTVLRNVQYSNYVCDSNLIEDFYKNYCEEFDKLNKHLLDEKISKQD